MTDEHQIYCTEADYNKPTNEELDFKIKQMKLVSKSDIANLAKNIESDRKGSNIYNKRRQLK